MTSTPGNEIRVEHLGMALEALGWTPYALSDRAATRTEMLGLLRFIVEAELHELGDEPAEMDQEAGGYMIGLDTRARQGTVEDWEYAEKYLGLWVSLIVRGLKRHATAAESMLETYDKVGGTDLVAHALTDALLQLMRIPATYESGTGQIGSAKVVREGVEKARPFVRDARQHLEDCRQKLKRLGY